MQKPDAAYANNHIENELTIYICVCVCVRKHAHIDMHTFEVCVRMCSQPVGYSAPGLLDVGNSDVYVCMCTYVCVHVDV